MHLYLSSGKAWRGDFATEDGRVLYKTMSPRVSIGGGPISITKLQRESGNSVDNYVPLAEIQYYTKIRLNKLRFKKSTIKIGNTDIAAKDLLKVGHTKLWTTGYGERNYDAPDGKQYTWKIGINKCNLFLKDTETLVATFHRKNILSRGVETASLEIFSLGEHMVDEIIITFVYMERLRKEELRTRFSAAGDKIGGSD
ncbi:hypothetical protein CPB83DRAFT_887643 [Crepidotus variabilis]|uniref:DUF6593 domain-containing protein n=1 Tax=Crepidotus variabilis TaxID=179855 RepID=A0A9P6JIS8_9AGAR|nr:hypothetical protein CPB83DRAFT_887643 [Crepidotus variabilis]